MKKAFISPLNLKALREQKGWSLEELAERSKLTSRRISSLEKHADDKVSVQQKTLTGLCKALGERADVLAGDAPLPKEGKPFDINVQLNPQTRLNYDLLKRKYGIDILDIINVAPLLFVSAAEDSLQRQQEQIDKDAEEFGKLSSLWFQISNLSETLSHPVVPWIPEGYSDEEYFAERRHAVKIKDPFETYLCLPHMYDEGLPRSDYPNPFADFLYEVSQRPLLKGTIELTDEREVGPRYWYSSSECIPDHRICLDVLKQITLGSMDAEKALEQGVASISEIPDYLWEPRKAGDRVAWLEDKYRQAEANLSEEDVEST